MKVKANLGIYICFCCVKSAEELPLQANQSIPERSGLQKYALYPLNPVYRSQEVDRRRDFFTLEEISLT